MSIVADVELYRRGVATLVASWRSTPGRRPLNLCGTVGGLASVPRDAVLGFRLLGGFLEVATDSRSLVSVPLRPSCRTWHEASSVVSAGSLTVDGVWAVKEIELFVPTVDVADANVELQESMLDAGVNLPRPRRTVDGHGLFGSVRVDEWLDLTPVPVGDLEGGGAGRRVTCSHAHPRLLSTDQTPDPWYSEAKTRDDWDGAHRGGSGHLVGDGPRRAHRRAGRWSGTT